VLDYHRDREKRGASCVLGGGVPRDPALGNGWFVEPTVFTGVDNSMRIAREEVFARSSP